ncbi:hypothetical protein, partial [Sulfitobacter sp.]|uniref:hypothetical protein n=1 Tax=Sulfitobacter sp. TaxID=1903071 RepID=UPI003F6B0405
MVDALASGASTGNGVEVRVLFWAPIHPKLLYRKIMRADCVFSLPRHYQQTLLAVYFKQFD